MTSVEIEGIEVSFPYEPYKCQLDYMRRVIECLNGNGALESPTGTGKTLSLLCSTLAWLQYKKLKLRPEVPSSATLQSSNDAVVQNILNGLDSGRLGLPRIFYASRTHSQLTQVVRELNKTVYKCLNIAVLGSRDQLCINESVCKETNSIAKANKCRALVSKKACRFYNQYDKNSSVNDISYTEVGRSLDIEDLVRIGTKIGECPFYRSRASLDKADLILLPYNYILDPRIRRANKIDLKGNVLIFDEAHNLEKICEDSASVSFSTADLSGCLREAKQTLENIMAEEEQLRKAMDETTEAFGQATALEKQKDAKIDKNDLAHLIVLLQKLEEVIDEAKLINQGKQLKDLNGRIFDGEFILKLLEKAEFRRDMRDSVTALVDRIGLYFANQQDNYEDLAVKAACSKSAQGQAKDKLQQDEQSKRFQLYVVPSKESRDCQTTANGEKSSGLTLNYWCFSAAVTMRFLQSRGVSSIVLTSGTLAPLKHFVHEMGIDFPVRLESSHEADATQVLTMAIQHGPKTPHFDVDPKSPPPLLNGVYANRENPSYVQGIGELLVQTARVTPQGVLVFFSSYAHLDNLYNAWQKQTTRSLDSIWSRLNKVKPTFVEPRRKGDLAKVMEDFDEAVSSGKGGILLAVCRGKVSEGIDFSDSHCRAVVVVGIPYAPPSDAHVCLKKNYLRERRAHKEMVTDAETWYTTDGYRAINQAMGRVIRHKDDFGAVILADKRSSAPFLGSTKFFQTDIKRFPAWLRASFKSYETFEPVLNVLRNFFKSKGLDTNHVRDVQRFPMGRPLTVVRNQSTTNGPPVPTPLPLSVQRQAVSTNQELLTIYKDVLPLHASVSAVTTAQNNIASKYRSMLHQLAEAESSQKLESGEPPKSGLKRQTGRDAVVCSTTQLPSASDADTNVRKRIKLKVM